MAKQPWDDDALASSESSTPSTGKFWEGDADAAQRDLPTGTKPSSEGGGRGRINPPLPTAELLTEEDAAKPAGALRQTIKPGKAPDRRTVLERSVEGATEGNQASLMRQERRANWEQDQIDARTPRATGTTRPKDDIAANRGADFALSMDGDGPISRVAGPVGRVIGKAGAGIAQGIGGVAEAVGDLTGIDPLARAGKATAEGAEAFQKGMGKPGDVAGFGPKSAVPYLVEQAEGAASSLGQSAVLAGAAGARSVIAAQAILQGGQSYNEARQAGMDPAAALARAIPQGAFEAIGEKFQGLDKVASSMGTLLQKGASSAAKRSAADVLVRAGIREIPGEVLTYLGQTGTDLIPGIGLNPNMTMQQFLEGLRDVTIQAGMMGGVMAGGGHAAGGQTNRAPQMSAADLARAKGFLQPGAPTVSPEVAESAGGAIPPAAAPFPSTAAPAQSAAAPAAAVPTAEPASDMAAQVEAIRDPSSGKTAALITPNTPAGAVDLTGLQVVDTNLGRFVTSDPDVAGAVAARSDAITTDEMGQLLGYTTPKAATDGTVVQALTPQGDVIHEEATNAANLPAATAQAETMAPEGGTVVQTDALAVQERRQERAPGPLARAAQASGALPGSMPTAMNDPKARPKTFAEQQEAMNAVASIEAQQEAEAEFEARMLADEALSDNAPSTTKKEAQDAPAKSPTPSTPAQAPAAPSAPTKPARTAAPERSGEDGGKGGASGQPTGIAVAADDRATGQRDADNSGVVDAPPTTRSPNRAGSPAPAPSEPTERTSYPSLAAATAHIRKQRALGTNIAAAAYITPDGEIVVAIKGTPEYETALDQRQERLKKEKTNERNPGNVQPVARRSDRGGSPDAGGGVATALGRADATVARTAAAPAQRSTPTQSAPLGDGQRADALKSKQKVAADEPPLADGMVRLYHGSAKSGRYDGPAWFSTSRQYAQDYRKGAELQYVDMPAEKVNAIADPDGYGQTVESGVTVNMEFGEKDAGTRKPLLKASMTPEAAVDAAANESATSPTNDLPEPTQAQKEAGNYKMGHLSGEQSQGIDITIENPKDSERSGTSPDGTVWKNKMGAHYGYAKRSLAADGDHVDMFVGPAADRAPTVWVIDQVNKDGTYDEAKALFGFMNKAAGVRAYKSSYMKGWKVGPITEIPVAEFKEGLESGRFKNALDAALSAVTPSRMDASASPIATPEQIAAAEAVIADSTAPASVAAPAPKKRTLAQLRTEATALGIDTKGKSHLALAEQIAGEVAAQTAPAPPAAPKPKRETKAAKAMREREEARANYFTPGNVVRGYGGQFDKVISYQPGSDGRWSVTVQRVEKTGPAAFKDMPSETERTHSTQPDERALRTGPAARMAVPDAPTRQELEQDARAALDDPRLSDEFLDTISDASIPWDSAADITDATQNEIQALETEQDAGRSQRGAEGDPGTVEGQPGQAPRDAASDQGNPARTSKPARSEAGDAGAAVQEVATNTPAFKAWFGKSKVVDSEGRPLVVYHGTSQDNDIKTFDGLESIGWFSTDHSLAETYAKAHDEGNGSKVMNVFLSIKKPLVLNFDMNDPATAASATAKKIGLDARNVKNAENVHEVVNHHEFMDKALSAGYDGIKVRERGVWTWAPLKRNQIKSATDNNGDFSQADDIRFSVADQTDSPAFKKWFGDSKVLDSAGKPKVIYHGTPSSNLTVFDASKIGANGRAEGAGFYFTTDKKTADGYGQRGETLQVYARITKPLAYNAKPFNQMQMQKVLTAVAKAEAEDVGGDWKDGFLSNYVDTYSKTMDSAVREAARAFANDETALDQVSGIIGSGVDASTVNTGLTNALGYDGYFSKGFSGEGQGGGDIWVAMRPEQIKSATGNSGAFDGKNPDIRMRTAEGAATPVKTKPASTEHDRKAARLLGNLKAGQDGYISFQAVEPDDAGAAGKMLAAVRLVAKRLFGHDVVFVRFNGPAAFNGAMSDSIPNTVFVRVDSSKPHMAILGHELLHSLRRNNAGLYAAMENRLNQLTNDKTSGFFADLQEKYKAIGRKAPEGSKLREELYADIVGDNFLSPEFWDGMAADQRGLFRRVADAIVRFLDKVIASLANTNPLGTNALLRDAQEARRVVIAGMRAFSDEARARSGLAPMKAGASAELSASTRKPAAATEFTRRSKVKHVVYHATSADFTTFDTSVERSDLGAHFGTVEQANKAATRGRTDGNAGPSVMPAYIDIRSPLRLKDVGTFHADGIAPQLAAKGWMTKAEAKAMVSAIDRDWTLRKKYDAQLRELIEAQGYDSVVYKNTHEGDGDSYIVFKPNQIKSATGNRGTFDRTNDDIRMSAEGGGDLTVFMKGSKVTDEAGAPLRVYRGLSAAYKPRAGMQFWTDSREAADDHGQGDGEKAKHVAEGYLNMKKPYVLDDDAAAKKLAGMVGVRWTEGFHPSDILDHPGAQKVIERAGYDGVVITDDSSGSGISHQTFVTFEPAQFKGADDVNLSAADLPKKSNPALTRAIFGGSMEYMRDQNGKPVKAADQIEKYKKINTDERGQMLLRLGHVTADQLKRWKASPLDMHDATVNKRFKKHFESPGIVWTDDELRRIFKLDDEGVAAYRELRSLADTSIARNAVADMLRLAGKDGLEVRDQVLGEPMDVAAITLRDHLLKLAGHNPAMNKVRTERANAVIDILDRATDDMANGMIPDDMKAQARPNKWEGTAPTTADRIIYEMQDGRIDLKRTQEAIEKTGNKIAEKFDARLAETLYSGRMAKRTQSFLEREAQPLLRSMAHQGIGQVELGDYLHARAAPERNAQIAKVNPDMPDGGAGANSKGLLLTDAAARQYIADIPAERRAKLEALAQKVDAITKGTRALLVGEGLEKADTIAAWEAVYKTYVPMFREDVEFSRITTSKRATGSEKKAVNILANVLLQREAAITRAEKNRIKVAMYGLALSNPNPDFWVTIRPESDRAQMLEDLKSMGIDPVEAEAGMASPPTVTTVDPATNLVTEQLNPFFRNLPTAISLKINGENRVLLLNENDPRAVRMADAMKGQDSLTKFDLAGSLVGRTTRWLAAVNTQYNPAFGIVNFMRDTLGGVIHLGNTELRGSGVKVTASLPGAIKGITAHLAGRQDSGKWSKLFEQFQQDGGQTGFREMFADGTRRAEAVERDLARMAQGRADPRRVARGLLSLLSGFNEVTENAVRLSAYAAALDKGISRPEAARLARELTVDFNRKGRATREIGPLYAFFNAAIQGNERTLRALRGPTGKYIITGGLALGVMQALMLAAAGYDDDEIPDYAKARALVIPLFNKEKGYILIPLPLGLHVIPNTGRVITEMILGNQKNMGKKAVDAIGEIMSAASPLGGGNIFTMDGALRTLAPTVIDPLLEIGFNKNFAGTPIEREARGETDIRPGFQRARESTVRRTTGQAYLGISKALNWATGGTEFEGGAISPTPEKVRYLAQVALGGVLRETEKIIDSTTAAARGEKTSANTIPIASRFYGKVDETRVEQSRYYENVKSVDKIEAAARAARKAGDGDAVEKIQSSPLFQFIRPANRVEAAVRKLNKMAVQVVGNREEQEAIDAARIETMKSLNDGIREMERSRRGPTLGDRLKVAAP